MATLERPASAPTHPEPTPVPRAGSLPTPGEQAQAAKDKTLTSPAAVELAHRALEEITDPITIGEYLAAVPNAERLVTHLFDCTLSGYRGWRWAVTLSRVPRSRTATVCEMELLPGEEALLAPAWVPWADRLEPGDITRSDRLPRKETDERLEPGWEATGEDADAVALDQLDLGRPRVLSAQGVSSAAERWYGGDHGPDAEGVRKAHATCSTCGFFVPMAGALRAIFGVCANEWATDDGSVVSLDHGCGAHSETDLPDHGPEWPINPSRVDDHLMVPLSTNGLDLREGQSIAELAAQQSGDDVDNDEDGANGGTDDATAQSAADAPGLNSDPDPSNQDVDTLPDDATAQSAADAPGLNSDPDPSNQDVDTLPDDAASNGVETATDSVADAAAPVTEADEDSRSRLLELDLADLGQRTAAAASAPSASDTAEVLATAAEPTSSTPASVETGDSPSERAASARAAVAGLSLALGIDTPQDGASAEETEGIDADSDDHLAPRTLAELEAILPDRS
ncbi:DUF3027 domain-containing protein [Actinomyces sp. oral taxon 849]|uniref:DUF3027 domain-containing protein n=1 Tax=Actinomyces sp. oral taxon 849 TaxID=653385 RepID=UPI0012E9EFC0